MLARGGSIPPRTEFDARSLGGVQQLRMIELDLTTARTDFYLNLKGTVFFFDQNTTGKVSVKWDTTNNPAFPCTANSGLNIIFNGLYLTHAAQAGKIARLWYGWDVGILPPNQDITSIGSIINPVGVDMLPSVTRAQVGTAFYAHHVFGTGAGSAYGTCGVWNPAGSGIVGALQSLEFSRAESGSVEIYGIDSIASLGISTASASNKRRGSSATSVLVHFQGGTTQVLSGVGSRIRSVPIPTGLINNQIQALPERSDVFVVYPGTGIGLQAGVPGVSDMRAFWEWYEIPQ